MEEGGGARVWDLSSGEEIGRLRGAEGNIEIVKCLQVEDKLCVTGGSDSMVRVWDLRRAGELSWDDEGVLVEHEDSVVSEAQGAGSLVSGPDRTEGTSESGPSVRVLKGHTRPITALHFEDNCLVRHTAPSCRLLSHLQGALNRLPVPPTRQSVNGISIQVNVS